MPFPVNVDSTWVNSTAVSMTAAELRRADAAGFAGDGTAFGVRGGIVRHGDSSLAVTVDGADNVTIQPGAVVIPGNAVSGTGCYRSALSVASTNPLPARNATNPRIDLIVFRQMDTDVVAAHAAFTGRIEVITGTPATTPSAPALPSMAVELARITVPVSGGVAATVDSSFRQYVSTVGGDLLVGSFARLPTSAAKWQRAVLLDTGLTYIWSGTAWVAEGAWVSFAYTLAQLPTAAGGLGYVSQVGKTVHLHLTATVTAAAGNTIWLVLPIPVDTTVIPTPLGFLHGSAVATEATIGHKTGFPYLFNSTQVRIMAPTNVPWSQTVPHTWKASDVLSINLTYPAA